MTDTNINPGIIGLGPQAMPLILRNGMTYQEIHDLVVLARDGCIDNLQHKQILIIHDDPYMPSPISAFGNSGKGVLNLTHQSSSSLVDHPEYAEPQKKKRRIRDNRTRRQRKIDNLKKGLNA